MLVVLLAVHQLVTSVDRYLTGIAKKAREALIRVDSYRGPAVDRYITSVADKRRDADIRVDSYRGPAVSNYIDWVARNRTATIYVQTVGTSRAASALSGLTGQSLRMATDESVQTRFGATTVTNSSPVNITVNGAVDPHQTAAQIKRLLNGYDSRTEGKATWL